MSNDAAKSALEAIASIPRECGEAVFAEPWEARAFAMAVALNERGIFTWSEWAELFSQNLKTNETLAEPVSYYRVWMASLEKITEQKGLTSEHARQRREQEWLEAVARTPHGQPIELDDNR